MTTKKKTQQDVALGEIHLPIVGQQYYSAGLKAGESLQFEREPDNVHDRNAIRIENDQFETIGHLPKREARWLAPLIDQGSLAIDGVAVEDDGSHVNPFTVKISLFLASKGKDILDPQAGDPTTGQEALALTIASAVKLAAGWSSPEAIRGLVKILDPVIGYSRSPESRLLRHLLEIEAVKAEQRREAGLLEGLVESLKGLKTGDSIESGRLTVVPLFLKDEATPRPGGPSVVHISYAIDEGLAQIDEVEGGVVSELELTNKSGSVILVPEGVILVGGMQDRVAAQTVIVEAHAVSRIPVLCVEQGRWNHEGATHSVAASAPPRIRSTARQTGDQSRIWAEVSSMFRESGQDSETETLLDVKLPGDHEDSGIELEIIEFPAGAVGAGYMVDHKLIGLEAFGTTELFAAAWQGLIAGYRLEAELAGGAQGSSTASLDEILEGAGIEFDKAEDRDPEYPSVRVGNMRGSYSDRGGEILHLSLLV